MPAATIAPVDPEKIIDLSIFEALGLDSIAQERKDSMLESMMETIEGRVLARVMDAIPQDQIPAFEAAIDAGGDGVSNFLALHAVDLVTLTAEEALIYKSEVIAMVGPYPKSSQQ